MKVEILSAFSDEVRSYEPGETLEFPDEKAARYIKAGLAVAIGAIGTSPEAATLADAPERAALPPTQKRGASPSA